MTRAFLVILFIFAYSFLIGSVCILIVLFQRKPDILYRAGRHCIGLALKIARVEIELRGKENISADQNYLFLANHQSYCDPPALVFSIPLDVRLILKKELRRLPLIGYILQLGGFVFVDRKDRSQAIEAMKQAVRQLRNEESFLIYPEGTRTRTGKMGPFKKGPFVLAIESGVPIIPVSVSGGYAIMSPHQFKITPGRIRVSLHPPIETKEHTLGMRELLMDQVWKTIASGLNESEYDMKTLFPEKEHGS